MNTFSKIDFQVPIRILVADDESDIRKSYRDILQPPGAQPANGGLQDMRAKLFGARRESKPLENFELTLCNGAKEAVHAVQDGIMDGRMYD